MLYLSLKEHKEIFEDYDEVIVRKILGKVTISFLNQAWQMLLKGKNEIERTSMKIETLEVLVIRIVYMAKLPTLEEVINNINKDEFENNEKELGNDIKKILEIFPGSEVIK